MIANQITAPTATPVSVVELKQHLKIDVDTENSYIDRLLAAAILRVEQKTGRQLEEATWDYIIQDWPAKDHITLPFGNLKSVTSVIWKDSDGVDHTLTVTTDYTVVTNGDRCGRIALPYNGAWPSGSLYPSNPITIRFVCGYATVPEGLKLAILMTAEFMYQRGDDKERYDAVIDHYTCNYRLYDEFS